MNQGSFIMEVLEDGYTDQEDGSDAYNPKLSQNKKY